MSVDAGTITLKSLDGVEISDGIVLVGTPTPIPGTSSLRCLANVYGALCLVEIKVKFTNQEPEQENC